MWSPIAANGNVRKLKLLRRLRLGGFGVNVETCSMIRWTATFSRENTEYKHNAQVLKLHKYKPEALASEHLPGKAGSLACAAGLYRKGNDFIFPLFFGTKIPSLMKSVQLQNAQASGPRRKWFTRLRFGLIWPRCLYPNASSLFSAPDRGLGIEPVNHRVKASKTIPSPGANALQRSQRVRAQNAEVIFLS